MNLSDPRKWRKFQWGYVYIYIHIYIYIFIPCTHTHTNVHHLVNLVRCISQRTTPPFSVRGIPSQPRFDDTFEGKSHSSPMIPTVSPTKSLVQRWSGLHYCHDYSILIPIQSTSKIPVNPMRLCYFWLVNLIESPKYLAIISKSPFWLVKSHWIPWSLGVLIDFNCLRLRRDTLNPYRPSSIHTPPRAQREVSRTRRDSKSLKAPGVVADSAAELCISLSIAVWHRHDDYMFLVYSYIDYIIYVSHYI